MESQAKSNDQKELMLQRQVRMFGDTKENILKEFDEGIEDPKIRVMSILSDVQELNYMDRTEEARMLTNVVKMLIMERL